MRSRLGLALLLAALGMACRTIETKRPIYRSQAARRASPTRMFEVEHEGIAQGYVVLFEAPPLPEDAVYIVRNMHQQDLGVIDALGRAFRYRPHEKEPTWLGSGSIPRGLQRILNTESLPALCEISLPQTPVPSLTRAGRTAITKSQRTN